MKAFVVLSFLAMVSVAGCGSSDTKLAEQVSKAEAKLSTLQATVTDIGGKVDALSKSLSASHKELADAKSEIAKLEKQLQVVGDVGDFTRVSSFQSIAAKNIFLVGEDKQPLITITAEAKGPFFEMVSVDKSSKIQLNCRDTHSSIIVSHGKRVAIIKTKDDGVGYSIQNSDEKLPRFSAMQQPSGDVRLYFSDGTPDGESRSYP